LAGGASLELEPDIDAECAGRLEFGAANKTAENVGEGYLVGIGQVLDPEGNAGLAEGQFQLVRGYARADQPGCGPIPWQS